LEPAVMAGNTITAGLFYEPTVMKHITASANSHYGHQHWNGR
jgi:hypothetical protein